MTATKLSIDEMILEVTRKCNMSCPHCLRGEAQNIDMVKETVDKALKDVESIGAITFTGGEPSLNTELIKYTLEYCKKHKIFVSSFFVATNGLTVNTEFVMTMLEWYAFIIDHFGEPELCSLALSKDAFHDPIEMTHIQLLKGLTFFDGHQKSNDFLRENYLINEGRAKELTGSWKKREPIYSQFDAEQYDDTINVCSQIYVSANGDIRTDCDTAYNNDACTIGNLYEYELLDIVSKALYDLENGIAV